MGNKHWTNEEIKIIQKSFHVMPDYATAKSIQGRTACAIASKRRALNLKYTQEWINEQLKLTRFTPY